MPKKGSTSQKETPIRSYLESVSDLFNMGSFPRNILGNEPARFLRVRRRLHGHIWVCLKPPKMGGVSLCFPFKAIQQVYHQTTQISFVSKQGYSRNILTFLLAALWQKPPPGKPPRLKKKTHCGQTKKSRAKTGSSELGESELISRLQTLLPG